MHKRLRNALRMEFGIKPKSPLLVKSGMLSPNPALPDMQFVRTFTPKGEVVYLPGSSLKGVFRSFTEKVLRTVDGVRICDPFGEGACGRKLSQEENTAKVYRESCWACKLYGNTRLRGRLSISDAYPQGEVKTETRYGVAISRLTNAVAHGPFEMEIVVEGQFKGTISLENFEICQLGLLALTLKAVNDGLVRIGFGKNRGFGEVEFEVLDIAVDLAKAKEEIPPAELWGVGQFVKDENERNAYGLRGDDLLRDLPLPASEENMAVFLRRTYDSKKWEEMAEKCIAWLSKALEESS